MAVIAARPHGPMHFRLQAVGLGPREYAALAARAHRAGRVGELLWRSSVVLTGIAAVIAVFLGIGAPLWLSASIAAVTFLAMLRTLKHVTHGTVIERHASGVVARAA
ncbi:MAG: hypothetical protein JO060_09455 [Candidatus Eremiobacteraeota bacterium]|nr:hypothetical protein [Candidatus Eremiobacteraeota bacterium]